MWSRFRTLFRPYSVEDMSDPPPKTYEEAVKNLRELGFGFNDSGELRKIDPATDKPGSEPFVFQVSEVNSDNQMRYDRLANQIPQIVYKLLEDNGLKRTYVPFNRPIEKATCVFSQPQSLSGSKKLMILIHGSGYVLAGQWARRLIINNSLDHGTQIPYIQRAQKLGYDILVTNTNDNTRTTNCRCRYIKGMENPLAHAVYVWENIVMPANPDSVAIVAHSFGASLTRLLAGKFTEFFTKKVFAIALTDGVIGYPPASCKKYFIDVTCNWTSGSLPLDENTTHGDKENNIKCVSAGHSEHEWTSYSAMESVFKFIEDKYAQRISEQHTEQTSIA